MHSKFVQVHNMHKTNHYTIHDYYIILYYIILYYIILYYIKFGKKVIAKLLAKSYLIFFLVRKHDGNRKDLDVDGNMLTL